MIKNAAGAIKGLLDRVKMDISVYPVVWVPRLSVNSATIPVPKGFVTIAGNVCVQPSLASAKKLKSVLAMRNPVQIAHLKMPFA